MIVRRETMCFSGGRGGDTWSKITLFFRPTNELLPCFRVNEVSMAAYIGTGEICNQFCNRSISFLISSPPFEDLHNPGLITFHSGVATRRERLEACLWANQTWQENRVLTLSKQFFRWSTVTIFYTIVVSLSLPRVRLPSYSIIPHKPSLLLSLPLPSPTRPLAMNPQRGTSTGDHVLGNGL